MQHMSGALLCVHCVFLLLSVFFIFAILSANKLNAALRKKLSTIPQKLSCEFNGKVSLPRNVLVTTFILTFVYSHFLKLSFIFL